MSKNIKNLFWGIICVLAVGAGIYRGGLVLGLLVVVLAFIFLKGRVGHAKAKF
ncbi:hypothetical protein [Desulfobacca acetoxidans]|uniref:hypothetical protein n=1 Tax=Desulfobacca acetoxidans TaxID=60893 RepID=UPI0002EBFB51|nr:hypothetical protein [Desulfobacca acetoxidans]